MCRCFLLFSQEHKLVSEVNGKCVEISVDHRFAYLKPCIKLNRQLWVFGKPWRLFVTFCKTLHYCRFNIRFVSRPQYWTPTKRHDLILDRIHIIVWTKKYNIYNEYIWPEKNNSSSKHNLIKCVRCYLTEQVRFESDSIYSMLSSSWSLFYALNFGLCPLPLEYLTKHWSDRACDVIHILDKTCYNTS